MGDVTRGDGRMIRDKVTVSWSSRMAQSMMEIGLQDRYRVIFKTFCYPFKCGCQYRNIRSMATNCFKSWNNWYEE